MQCNKKYLKLYLIQCLVTLHHHPAAEEPVQAASPSLNRTSIHRPHKTIIVTLKKQYVH